ncbi:hypothetical protein ACHAWF_018455 [Thalassiosira exigua]
MLSSSASARSSTLVLRGAFGLGLGLGLGRRRLEGRFRPSRTFLRDATSASAPASEHARGRRQPGPGPGRHRPTFSSSSSSPSTATSSSYFSFASSTFSSTAKEPRRAILSAALARVRDEGWTDEAVASGTLDAGFPPSYVGRASSATSSFGCADLVAFFMDECNADLRRELRAGNGGAEGGPASEDGNSLEGVSSRVNRALKARLSMVLPFVASDRWHEGMAIGALPQNAFRTARQLDEMAIIVLNYALGRGDAAGDRHSPAHRAAVVAAYAAAELHLLSDGTDGALNGSSLSLSGERHRSTWTFLEARSAEAARLIVDGARAPSFGGIPLPDPTHVAAASAVASSLAGAALSLAAPSAAAAAGYALPRAAASVLAPLREAMGSRAGARGGDGTKPGDYVAVADDLPPFDSSEDIFPESKLKGHAS